MWFFSCWPMFSVSRRFRIFEDNAPHWSSMCYEPNGWIPRGLMVKIGSTSFRRFLKTGVGNHEDFCWGNVSPLKLQDEFGTYFWPVSLHTFNIHGHKKNDPHPMSVCWKKYFDKKHDPWGWNHHLVNDDKHIYKNWIRAEIYKKNCGCGQGCPGLGSLKKNRNSPPVN